MDKKRTVLASIGVVFILAAATLWTQPSLLPPGSLPQIGTVTSTAITGILVTILGFYGIRSFTNTRVSQTEAMLNPEQQPEIVDDADDNVITFDNMSDEEVKDRLAAVVRRILRQQYKYDDGAAARTVQQGKWTEDRTAAAFITTSIPYPILERLRAWLEEHGTTDRRIKTAIQAIEHLTYDS